jgi:membrane protease YdiL (CAAX protease family)
MSNAFLDLAAQGKNEKGSYELTTVGVVAAGGLALVWAVIIDWSLLPLVFVVTLIVLVAGVKLIHKRSPLTLLTPNRSINWGRLAWGAGVWVALLTFSAIIEGGQFPEHYTLNNATGAWPRFALIAIALIPLQAASVELFFRGYLLQGMSNWACQPLVLCALSGLAYALPHYLDTFAWGSIDPGPMLAGYFVFGAGLAALTLRTESAELAVGLHIGHNFFLALGAHSSEALVNTPALFSVSADTPWYQVGVLVVALLVVWVLVERQHVPGSTQAGAAVPESLTK